MKEKKYYKEVLQCRGCDNVFHQSDVDRIPTEHLGQIIQEGACPSCGSNSYGLVDYPVDERELTYKDERFYGLTNTMEDYIDMYKNDEYMREVIDQLYI